MHSILTGAEWHVSEHTSLHRHVGGLGLLFISIGAMIGSGWLFSAMYAAEKAGPASIISWGIGAVMMGLIALVFAELGATLPLAGGLARYPHLGFGGLTSFIAGWLCWLGYVVIAPVETLAILEYLGNIVPWLTTASEGDRSLTLAGTAVAAGILVVLTGVNFLGVRWLARANTWLTWWKLAVPVFTAIVLVIVGFDVANFTSHEFAPQGLSGIFSAVSAGGVVFSLIGFRAVIELSGESRNPQRDVPRAIIGSILIVTLIYIMLQVAFIGVIPEEQLVHGWSGVVMNGASGPFAAFAMILGLSWLAVILYVDATASPLGTALVYTAGTSRLNVAMSRNRNIPAFIGRVNKRGLPVFALLLNMAVGMVLLAPLPAWDELAGIVSCATVLTGGIGALSLIVLRRAYPDIKRPFRLPAGTVIASLAFMSSAMVVYWCGWAVNRTVAVVLVAGILFLAISVLFVRKNPRDLHVLHGIWLLPYLGGLFLLSWLGDYEGGLNLVPAPWGDVAVAGWSLVIIPLAVRSGLPRHKSSSLVASAHEELENCPGFNNTD